MFKRFKGYSIAEVMDMDIAEFSQLSKSQLREAVSKLSSAANKRLKRLADSSYLSPAQHEADVSGGKFGTKGKSEIELQVEFRRVSNFLKNESSTVKGAKALEEMTRQELSKRYGITISKQNYHELLQQFSKLTDEAPDFQARKLRYGKMRDFDIGLADNTMTTHELSETVSQVLNKYYAAGGSQYEGVARYFGFE